ncbi:DNA polymerase III subunit epsilon [Amphibiibacter pelophylacis]|uniref:DNA polymerase III subunit epsilon n=1 Tax=Amphibiibacter pelophylacis TaxID=1799477 RepID=A0ACC6P031_9BURK
MLRQIFLDTETTGFSPDEGDRIVEIGCVEYIGREPTGNDLHFYLNPERDSSEGALRVHGLTTEFLSDKPLFAAIARELADYLRGAEVIIHNAPFDTAFLDAEFSSCGQPRLKDLASTITDSLVLARQTWPGKMNSLDALCKRLDVDNTGRTLHGALLDAGLLGEVFVRMTRGQKTLFGERDEASGASSVNGQKALRRSLPPALRGLELPVPVASAEELAAHQAMLSEIDKSSGGKLKWPKAVP